MFCAHYFGRVESIKIVFHLVYCCFNVWRSNNRAYKFEDHFIHASIHGINKDKEAPFLQYFYKFFTIFLENNIIIDQWSNRWDSNPMLNCIWIENFLMIFDCFDFSPFLCRSLTFRAGYFFYMLVCRWRCSKTSLFIVVACACYIWDYFNWFIFLLSLSILLIIFHSLYKALFGLC